ncbi:hypothetical protein Arth_3145 [Arthrobacter sp. FB24]|nr:hypothetical protein Arth_3145 [Arthrobacter sp. FB24]
MAAAARGRRAGPPAAARGRRVRCAAARHSPPSLCFLKNHARRRLLHRGGRRGYAPCTGLCIKFLRPTVAKVTFNALRLTQ